MADRDENQNSDAEQTLLTEDQAVYEDSEAEDLGAQEQQADDDPDVTTDNVAGLGVVQTGNRETPSTGEWQGTTQDIEIAEGEVVSRKWWKLVLAPLRAG